MILPDPTPASDPPTGEFASGGRSDATGVLLDRSWRWHRVEAGWRTVIGPGPSGRSGRIASERAGGSHGAAWSAPSGLLQGDRALGPVFPDSSLVIGAVAGWLSRDVPDLGMHAWFSQGRCRSAVSP